MQNLLSLIPNPPARTIAVKPTTKKFFRSLIIGLLSMITIINDLTSREVKPEWNM